ncbi:uncharacterized protein EMH_0098180 [Eimeria mitis]|uniref:Uncharacterized protein n=1 Tax=Eimeria mitis TaxID=44415 RepID=U6KFU6_9EIME|nr:uncharacterized protein EMH_0098180 [Eimeria mitis]CDJ36890.1 hypothetical protein EMH_0098180 [Eimeria mitis]
MSANCHTAHARGGGYGVEPQDSKSFSSVYAREQHMHIPGQQQQIQLQQPVSSLQQQYVLQQRGVPLRQRQLHTQQTMQQPEVRPHRRDKEQFPRQQHQELLQHQDLGHAGLNQRGWEVPSQQTHAASGEALQQQLQQQQLQRQQQLQLQHQMEHQLLPGSLRDDEAQRSSQASQQQERRGLQETRQQRPMLAAGDPQQQRQLRKEVPGAHSVAQAKEHRRQQQQQQRQMLPLGSEQQCLKQWMHSTQSLQLQQQQLLLLQQQQLQQQLPFPSAAEQHVEQEEHQRLVPPTISQTEPLSFEQMLETTAVHLHQQNDFRCQQPAYLQQLQQSVRRQDAEEAQLPIRHQQELCGSLLLKTEPSDDPEKS